MSHSNPARQRAHQRSHRRRPASRAAATRTLCRQAASLERPLDLERWASSLLGQLWVRRHWVPGDYEGDPLFYGGEPMVRSFAQLGGTPGKTALTAIAKIDQGQLGELAAQLATSLTEAPIPDWVADVGTAKIVKAFAYTEPGDGEAMLLDTDCTGDAAHMLAVFIREQLGGIATVLRLIRRIDPSGAAIPGEGDYEARLTPVDPIPACLRVLAAIDRSDEVPPALIDGEDYAADRAIAIARVTRHLARR
jgi:hypothetical protein